MPKELSDAELVRLIQGDLSGVAFAKKLGVAPSMLSDWKRGAVAPRRDTWIKLGNQANSPYNGYCWERAGLLPNVVNSLLEIWGNRENPARSNWQGSLRLKSRVRQSLRRRKHLSPRLRKTRRKAWMAWLRNLARLKSRMGSGGGAKGVSYWRSWHRATGFLLLS